MANNIPSSDPSKLPQAKDDSYNESSGFLVLNEDQRGTNAFQVRITDLLSNDLGGSAKGFYGLGSSNAATLASEKGALLTFQPQTGTIKFDAGTRFDYLRAGQSEIDTFTYTIKMANGALSTAKVTVLVQGTNDAASISGQTTGSVTEDTTTSTSGKLIVSDVDTGEARFQPIADADLVKTYGSFVFDAATGQWSYALDHAKADSLTAGQVVHDKLTVKSLDGTASEVIDVTITGTNDAASISGQTTGSVTEDTTTSTSGKLIVSDVDTGEARFQSVADADLVKTYGSFAFDAATGQWSYDLDHAKADSLTAGQVMHDTLTVKSLDGTASEVIDVTITGTNDVPLISGDNRGSVTEDTAISVSGKLIISDADTGEARFQPIPDIGLAKTYGTFSFDIVTGDWSYTLDHNKADGLKAGQVLTEFLPTRSIDGTAGRSIIVTVTGTNDVPTISGQTSGSVVEDTTTTTSGSFIATDIDRGESRFQQVADVDLLKTYGSFAFDAATGQWSYALDHAKADSLTAGQVVHDKLTVKSLDGTASEVIDVTITGTNDAASISGQTTGSVTEDTTTSTSGKLIVTDVDTGEARFQSVADADLVKTYGSFAFDAATGQWSYDLDHAKADSLTAGQVVHDTLTVKSLDGTASEVIDVTITGTPESKNIVTLGVLDATLVRSGTPYSYEFKGLAVDPGDGKVYEHLGYGFDYESINVYQNAVAFETGAVTTVVPFSGNYNITGTYFVAGNGDIFGRAHDFSNGYPSDSRVAQWDATTGALESSQMLPNVGGQNGSDSFQWGGFSAPAWFRDSDTMYTVGHINGTNTWQMASMEGTSALEVKSFNFGSMGYGNIGYGFVVDDVFFFNSDYQSDVITSAFDFETSKLISVNIDLGIEGPNLYISNTSYDATSDTLYLHDTLMNAYHKISHVSDGLFVS
ncbi:VCBS domain-containing protein [Methylorubrum extorquens]|uniref:VCBS domain-containing protein n=1 Tax=Methylorubrum extorquens TaxID=408 RepID=UPI00209FE9AA|nr:VCBS domain-containing protein [Methylorubrum extorquens]